MTVAMFAPIIFGAWMVAAPAAAPQTPPHTGHQHPAPPQPQQPQPTPDHSAHKETPPGPSSDLPKDAIPPLTNADRAAAFPSIEGGHAVHDRTLTTFVLLDQLEWQGEDSGGVNVDSTSWIGGDVNRVWIRAEGESANGDVENAFVHALWGHSFSRWWDVVAGVRQDFRPGDPQTWAAVGIQGLAPYWFEVEATGYVGAGGRTHARFETEYDLLITNRLVLQPLVEVEMYGKDDPDRGIGAGLSSIETGLRLRYEIRRELAPYLGVAWNRKLFGTADLAREQGHDVGGARLVAGLRTWF